MILCFYQKMHFLAVRYWQLAMENKKSMKEFTHSRILDCIHPTLSQDVCNFFPSSSEQLILKFLIFFGPTQAVGHKPGFTFVETRTMSSPTVSQCAPLWHGQCPSEEPYFRDRAGKLTIITTPLMPRRSAFLPISCQSLVTTDSSPSIIVEPCETKISGVGLPMMAELQ